MTAGETLSSTDSRSLRRLLCSFRDLTLMGCIKLAQHVVERTGKAPDLVLARIVDTMAIVSCLAYPPCQSFKAPERPHDMAVSEECEEDADRGQRPGQQQAAVKLLVQAVDAALEQIPQRVKSASPSIDRIVRGATPEIVKSVLIDLSRIAEAVIERAEVGGHARQHHCHRRLDLPTQRSVAIAPVG